MSRIDAYLRAIEQDKVKEYHDYKDSIKKRGKAPNKTERITGIDFEYGG